jgi:hypothetical protein
MNNPNITLSCVRNIVREDVKHFNPDGSFWICSRLRFKDGADNTLMTITMYGGDNIPHGPEIDSQPMREYHGMRG